MKKNIFFTFFLFAVTAFQNLCLAQNSFEKPRIFSQEEIKNGVDIVDSVKYSLADDPAFAEIRFDDSKWQYENFGMKNKFRRNHPYWIRYYFKVDSTVINEALCFDIKQLGASEIYLNGKILEKIGKIGDKNSREYKIKNRYPEIFTLHNTDVNVLAVRFVPFITEKKMTVNLTPFLYDIHFISANKFIKNKAVESQYFNFYTMLVSGIFGTLGFVHLLLFLFYRKVIYNLYFSVYNFSISLMSYIVLLISEMTDPLLVDTYAFLTFLSILAFATALTGFVNTLFAKSKLRLKMMLSLSAALLILLFISGAVASVILTFYLMFVIIESLFLIIKVMIRREKSAFIVGGGILLFFLFIIIVIFCVFLSGLNIISFKRIFGGDTMAYIFGAIFISFPISISAYLAWQFASTNLKLVKQLEEVSRLSDINLKQEQEKQQILQNQNEVLEQQVNERTSELQQEKIKTENLLLNILPHEVAEELKENGSSEAKYYDEVSVLFTDFVDFTQISEKIGAEKMLVELNECFTAFDMIMEKHGLEKIKTIGDAYLAVCGLPNKDEQHAYKTVLVAFEIIEYIEERKKNNPDVLDIRIGINSGSLITGIVGLKKFAYDIWGDTVNTAARMEQNSSKGKMNI